MGDPNSTFLISNHTFGRLESSFWRMLLLAARCDHTITCLPGGWQDYFPFPTQSPAPLLAGRAFPPRPSPCFGLPRRTLPGNSVNRGNGSPLPAGPKQRKATRMCLFAKTFVTVKIDPSSPQNRPPDLYTGFPTPFTLQAAVLS